jgi:hypothetical protein
MITTIEKLSTKGQLVANLLILLLDLQQQKKFEKALGVGKLAKVKELESSIRDKFHELDFVAQFAVNSLLKDLLPRKWYKWVKEHCTENPKDKAFFNNINEHTNVFMGYAPGSNMYVQIENTWELIKVPVNALDWYCKFKKEITINA